MAANAAAAAAGAAAGAAPNQNVPAAGAAGHAGNNNPTLADKIQEVRTHAADLRKAKREAAKELKLLQKKRSRLMQRARELSDGDLVEVARMRAEAKAKAKAAAKAQA